MAKRMFSGMVTALVGLLTLTLFMKASLSRACAAPLVAAPLVKVVGIGAWKSRRARYRLAMPR